LAETIKHACLGDETLFEILERDREKIMARDPDVLCRIIERSVMVKAGIVSKDLKETGVRAYLNLGHTFAHALESILSLKESRHGEAVAWGLVKAMETGLKLGVTDQIYARRVIDLVRVYGFDLDKRVDIDKFLAAAGKDKKRRDGKVRYVLQREMGETLLQEVDREIISSILSTG